MWVRYAKDKITGTKIDIKSAIAAHIVKLKHDILSEEKNIKSYPEDKKEKFTVHFDELTGIATASPAAPAK